MIKQAIEKIEKELKSFKGGKGEAVMKNRCAEVLKAFCEQNEEFAQAVVQMDRTFSDCLSAIWKKFNNKARTDGISDLDAFKTMVQFYFPSAGVHFAITVDVEANEPVETFDVPQATANDTEDTENDTEDTEVNEAPEQATKAEPKKKSLNFNLDDFI